MLEGEACRSPQARLRGRFVSTFCLWAALGLTVAGVLADDATSKSSADEATKVARLERAIVTWTPAAAAEAARLAQGVTIYRDAWGVPHIHGQTDAHVVFGYAYAQAEDYFWQVEDTYILALGRYCRSARPSRV